MVDIKTIPMLHPETGASADVHPAEVKHMKDHGWLEAPQKPEPKPEAKPEPKPAKKRKAKAD